MPFTPRFRSVWRLRTLSLEVGQRTLIMGILNVTPDSFSDGGRFFPHAAALDQALRMLNEGADILDIGGESTRPSSTPISPAEEQRRVLPVIRSILAARPDAVLSIDTCHAETARAAVDAGVEIVNDVSGHLWDPAMSATCAELACGNIMMHTRGRPQQWRTQPPLAPHEVVPLVLHELRARVDAALAAGIARDSIVLDPGFGFGKIMDENLPLLAHFDQLHSLGFPLLAGLSRKSFLTRGAPSGLDQQQMPSSRAERAASADREVEGPPHSSAAAEAEAQSSLVIPRRSPIRANAEESASASKGQIDPDLPTSSANMAAVLAGAHILRVHEVAAARQVAALADRLRAAADQQSA